MTPTHLLRGLALAALLAAAAPAPAAELYLHAGRLTWSEDDQDGRRLLDEKGPLYGVGVRAVWAPAPALELAGRLEGFLGEVDYDGETQAGEPVETTTEYYGLVAEGDVRLPLAAADRLRLLPFAGLGARPWLRRLDNTRVDSGGYDEEWISLYGRAGLRAEWGDPAGTQLFAEAALRRPFYTSVRYILDLDGHGGDVSVEPGAEWTVAAEAGLRWRGACLTLFYEDLAFGRSDPESIPPFDIAQNESSGQILGLRLGVDL
jgi:hypothetical protein